MTYIKKSKINFSISIIVFIFGVTKQESRENMPYAGSITQLENGACKTTKEWEKDKNVYGIGAFLINTDDCTFKVADGIKTYNELEIYIINK